MDWTASGIQETFEYLIVDPTDWSESRFLRTVADCSIERDSSTSLIESAKITVDELLGEQWVRAYLVATLGAETAREALGTLLVQTPTEDLDGKVASYQLDAYSVLKPIADDAPSGVYSVAAGSNPVDVACEILAEHGPAPVIKTVSFATLPSAMSWDDASSYLDIVYDLLGAADYTIAIDGYGRISVIPKQDNENLSPIWIHEDGINCVYENDVTVEKDYYSMPNVVRLTYSSDDVVLTAEARNDDPLSPISTVSRGREVVYKDTSPSITGSTMAELQAALDALAETTLKEKSSLLRTVSYHHGHVPTVLGNCVRFVFGAHGMDVTGTITKQTYNCSTGCSVDEEISRYDDLLETA